LAKILQISLPRQRKSTMVNLLKLFICSTLKTLC